MNNRQFVCKLCASFSGDLIIDHVRDSNNHSVFRCKSCGHVQLFPIPFYEENKQFYNDNAQATWVRPTININAMRQHLSTDTIRRADFIESLFSKKRNVLDLGSGFGFFTEEMLRRGWNIWGLEISRSRREVAAEITGQDLYNFDVCRKNEIPKKLIRYFDVVVAFQVFEHILNPLSFLNNLKKILVPGGSVVLEIPNRDDHMINLCDKYRDFYYQKAHLSYYNSNDIIKLLKKSGYSDITTLYVQRYSIENAMHWMEKKEPQINTPSFKCKSKFQWLDDYYRSYLTSQGMSDTILAIGKIK